MERAVFFLACAVIMGGKLSAASIYFQKAEERAGEERAYYWSPELKGHLKAVPGEIEDKPVVRLPVEPEEIEWMRVVSREMGESLRGGAIVQGTVKDGKFQAGEVIATQEKSQELGLGPSSENLLTGAAVKVFGAEERASFKKSGEAVEVSARAGTKPAGILITFPNFQFPAQDFVMEVSCTGKGVFKISGADSRQSSQEESTELGSLLAESAMKSVRIQIPVKSPSLAFNRLILSAPNEESELKITSLRIVKKETGQGRDKMSTWIWSPEAWKNPEDGLLDKLEAAKFRTVYISIQLDADGKLASPETLRRFLTAAGRRRMEVWAVDGDPRAIFREERGKFVRRARAIEEFNKTCDPSSGIRGIQWDIEPYLIPGFDFGSEEWSELYLETLRELRASQELPLELCIPFWLAGAGATQGALLARLAALADGVVVMDYRTQEAQIRESARPFLEWGNKAGRKVKIALELGPIEDEKREHYSPATEGTLWCVPFGDRSILVSLKKSAQLPLGFGLARSRESAASGDRVTFQRRFPELRAMMPGLEEYFSGWGCFEGMALHEAQDFMERLIPEKKEVNKNK